MSGPTGASPVAILSERQRCPEAPTKRKYATSDEAWDAARARTAETHIEIAPYACAGCGHFHLTKNVTGSDVLTRQDGGLVLTGAQRKSNHPVFARRAERDERFLPVTPGNRGARIRAAQTLLATIPEPTTADVKAALNCSVPTAQEVMRELGYVSTRGRKARWVKAEDAPAPKPRPEWETLDTSRIAHMPVGDLLAAYAALGVEIRVQVRR